jgi:SAM-dependent methyltransferase
MRDLERYQDDYAALPFEGVQAAYRRRHLIEALARHGGRHVLEIGCGTEPLFLHYRDFESMHVIEPAGSFHAKALTAARGVAGVEVLHGTLEALAPGLTGTPFDCVVMSSLLHEVPDPLALLACARTLCSSTTDLHVYVPNAHSFHRLLALEMGLIQDVHEVSATQARMQQSSTYDAGSMRTLLESAGFEVNEVGSFFIKPFTHAQMAALREKGILTDAMLEGLYSLGRHFPDAGSELYARARARV